MPDSAIDSYVFPPLDGHVLKSMLETAKAATAPNLASRRDRLADKVTKFCGSWTFILCFSTTVAGWAALNIFLATTAFDPYPFVFLNLCLTVAMSLQSSLILMSQRRQNKQNRRESIAIYALALKAEAEGAERGLELARMEAKLDLVLRLLEREPAAAGVLAGN